MTSPAPGSDPVPAPGESGPASPPGPVGGPRGGTLLDERPDVEVFEVEALDDAEPPRPGRLPYFPGLDGLRGLCVLAVLAYHAGVVTVGDRDLSAPGGYLGVSTFFTLSGFLITSLLLGEHRDTAKVSVSGFYARRLRRLMPAAIAGVALAVLVVWDVGTTSQTANLRGDVVGALFYVANWHFVVENTTYAEAFSAPSPLLHYWSLAIEEQFYVLFPVVVGWILTTFGHGRRMLGLGLAAGTAASVGLVVVADLPTDRMYFGTDARLAELLIGALAAVALFSPRITRFLGRHTWLRVGIGLAGLGVLALTVWLWASAGQRSSPWVFDGGLALYAVGSVVLVLAASLPGSPVKLLLSFAPLRWIGLVSYGLYVVHFPVFLWVQARFPDLEPANAFALKLGLSLALAVASYRLIERPVRAGRPLARMHPAKFAPVPVLAILLALLLVTRSAPSPDAVDLVGDRQRLPEPGELSYVPVPGGDYRELTADELAALEGVRITRPGTGSTVRPPSGGGGSPGVTFADNDAETEPVTPDTTEPPVEPPAPPTVLLVGGSEALALLVGAVGWAEQTGLVSVHAQALTGCGIVRGGTRIDENLPPGEQEVDIPDDCENWSNDYANALAVHQPDIVIMHTGVWDTTGHRLSAGGEVVAPGDPAYDAHLRNEWLAAAQLLTSGGAELMWLDVPPCDWGRANTPPFKAEACSDGRVARANQVLGDVAAQVPGMHVLDYTGYLASWPGGVLDPTVRPDGIHVDTGPSLQVASWLIPTALNRWFT